MNLKLFQQKILQWYRAHKRDLPWRRTTDPYPILVSEMMLQQTQVDRVLKKYEPFLEAFPTIHALATAPRGEVLAQWSGLGYNRRALHLRETAIILLQRYQGHIPQSRDALLELPGIGSYTANAILSFAFNLPYPCIDTNIRRIFIHELHLAENTTMKELYSIAENLIPEGKSRDWHNALMDYGSAVATARKTGIQSLTKQSPFLHSRRWYRGQIMKILVKEKNISLQYLAAVLKKEEAFVEEILEEMEGEKLLCYQKPLVKLP